MSENKSSSKKQALLYILVGAATLGMVAIGVPSLRSPSGVQEIATINGQSVGQYQFNQVVNNLRSRNPDIETAKLRQAALDSLIVETVMTQHALKSGYQYSDKALYQYVKNQFGTEQDYKNMLTNNHLTATAYQNGVRQEQTVSNYYQFLQNAQIGNTQSVDVLLNILLQSRDFEIITLPITPFSDAVNVNDADLQKYFEAHKDNYRTLETTSIRYVLLDQDKLVNPASITDEQMQAERTKREADIQRDGHYVIFDKPEVAEKAVADIKDGSKTFTDIMQAVDKGEIAGQAGKLDMHAKGKGVSEEADNALFSLMNKGDVSPLFETEYGKMLVQLGDSSAPKMNEADIRQAVAEQVAEVSYNALANSLFDAVQNGDSIESIAQKAGAEVQVLDNLTPSSMHPDWLANPDVQKDLFGDSATSVDKMASPVQIDNNRSIFIYIASRDLPKIQNFDVVREKVVEDYKIATAKEAQQKAGDTILSAWNEGKDIEQLINDAHGQYEKFTDISRDKIQMSHPDSALLANALAQTERTKMATMSDNRLTITRLLAIKPPKDADATDEALRAQLQRQLAVIDTNIVAVDMAKILRNQAKIKINEVALNQAE